VKRLKNKRLILCGSNAYEQKYYYNEQFASVPNSVKEDLKILCVLFTEQIGGILTILFEEDGSLALETTYAETDIVYDEIGSGLLLGEVRRKRQDLMESLSLYYKVVILGETIETEE